uniref:GPI ethanolamine phosphate transferase 1 n=1 Tax=Cacopsylla melanoneura TaxID=428564 RepID=A0A8D8W1V1_9HEMI
MSIVGTHETNKYLLIIAGFSCLVYSTYSTSIYPTIACSTTLLMIQRILLGVTVVHVFFWTVPQAYGVQVVVSWLILVVSPLSILLSPSEPKPRLLCIGFALTPPFILLCASYEVFFVLVLLIHLVFWFDLECFQSNTLIHQSFLILVYLFLSFFGLGNIASVNSYDWSVVRFFISVFSPFTMLSFFLLKIFIPFLLVSCTVRAIHVACSGETHSIQAPTETVLLLVLVMCDVMGLVFLFLVRNTGSWKDIGLSISHVVIVNCITLALMCLYSVASYLVPADERRNKGRFAT